MAPPPAAHTLDHRALVLSPFRGARGNATTAWRTARRLEEAGATAAVVLADPAALRRARIAFVPDAVHGIHAGHTLRALAGPGELGLPLVLSIGGNDLHELLGESTEDAAGHLDPAAVALVRAAGAVVCATARQAGVAATLRGDDAAVVLAPRAPLIGHAPIPDLPRAFPGPVVAWSGALRRQKRPAWILPIHRGLRARLPDLTTLVTGPPPADDAERALAAELAREPGVAILAPFAAPDERGDGAVGTLLARVDLVLNTSRTEGLSNFLLEALHEGRPVVAARTAGNRDWLGDRAVLYDTPEEAVEAASRLLTDASARDALVARGRAWIARHADPADERAALARAHRLALGVE